MFTHNQISTFHETESKNANDKLNQLALQYQNGNKDTFNELYHLTFKIVSLIVRNYFPNDQPQREDCIQEIYLNLYRKFHYYDPQKGDFLPWFKKTAQNICATNYKKCKRGLPPNDDEDHSIHTTAPTPIPDVDEIAAPAFYFNPDAAMEANQISSIVDHIIEQLPPQHKECLLMHISGDPQKDISEHLGIPLGTVKSRIYYGKKLVKQKVLELEQQGLKLYSMSPITFFAWAYAKDCEAYATQHVASNLLFVKEAATRSKKNIARLLFSKLQSGVITGSATMNLLIVLSATAIIGTGAYYSISRSNPKLPQLPRLPMMQNFPLSDFSEESNEPAPPMDVQNDTNREDSEDITPNENIENVENATTPTPNTPTETPADVPIDQILTIGQSHYFKEAGAESFQINLKLASGHTMPGELEWSTDADPSIMTVDQNGWVHMGTNVPSQNYTATVTVRYGNHETHCKVTVVIEPIQTNLPYSYHEILANQTFQCTASPGAQWSSNNPTIASITPDGLLETHKYGGEVTLTVAYPNNDLFTTSFRLQVKLPGISLVDTEGTLSVGSSNSIPINPPIHSDFLRTDLFFSPAFSYYSSNPEVASFDKTTVTYDDYSTLTAHMPGTTEIVIRALFPTTPTTESEFRKTIVVQ